MKGKKKCEIYLKNATAFFNKNECLSVAKKQAWDEYKSEIANGNIYIVQTPDLFQNSKKIYIHT